MKVTKNKFVSVLAPAGLHVAIIIRVLDMGTQKAGKFGEKPQVRLVAELPDELHEFKEGEGEKPFSVFQDYNRVLGDTSHLGKAIAGILGRPLTAEEEEEGIDLAELAGKMVMVQVQHSKPNKDKKQFANIVSFAPLPKSEKRKLKPVNEIIVVDLDPDNFDQSEFDKLPLGTRKRIAQSPEYKEVGAPVEDKPGQSANDDDTSTVIEQPATKGKSTPKGKTPPAKTPAKNPAKSQKASGLFK